MEKPSSTTTQDEINKGNCGEEAQRSSGVSGMREDQVCKTVLLYKAVGDEKPSAMKCPDSVSDRLNPTTDRRRGIPRTLRRSSKCRAQCRSPPQSIEMATPRLGRESRQPLALPESQPCRRLTFQSLRMQRSSPLTPTLRLEPTRQLYRPWKRQGCPCSQGTLAHLSWPMEAHTVGHFIHCSSDICTKMRKREEFTTISLHLYMLDSQGMILFTGVLAGHRLRLGSGADGHSRRQPFPVYLDACRHAVAAVDTRAHCHKAHGPIPLWTVPSTMTESRSVVKSGRTVLQTWPSLIPLTPLDPCPYRTNPRFQPLQFSTPSSLTNSLLHSCPYLSHPELLCFSSRILKCLQSMYTHSMVSPCT
ncbi:hypothetical protein VP01_5017g1 [Puccinia sorghi]|uniref:Uncharacterized protein n=1 Tax=Puccinia sorghi TaxID=27349 RepID=A0A0L6ULL9_9BASI|nr:hypothetical protein VP01_5017g1 [Puccinia sorghi]